jgi:hypothetical protein
LNILPLERENLDAESTEVTGEDGTATMF